MSGFKLATHADTDVSAEQSHFCPEGSSKPESIQKHSSRLTCRESATKSDSTSALPAQPPLYCLCCGDIIRAATSSSPSTGGTIVPRRRFQKGQVLQRSKKWAGSFRDTVIDKQTGELKRVRRTVTFDSNVTSRRAALRALQPYLDKVNVEPPSPPKGGKTVADL